MLDHDELAGVGEVARAASSAQGATERAENVLAAIRGLVPYDSALLSIADPISGSQTPLAHCGYSELIVEHLCSRSFEEELIRFGTLSSGRATRAQDLPCDPEQQPTWSQVLSPAGFTEGLTICLKAASGRYVGTLSLSVQDATAAPTDGVREAIDLLSGTLANVTDAAGISRRLADQVEPGATAFMIGLTGPAVPLPDTDGSSRIADHMLGNQSRLAADARRLLQLEQLPARFVWHPPDSREWCPVRVIPCEVTNGQEPRALVIVGLPTTTYGLTVREIEVLTLLAEGWSNKSISDHFVISTRTVETHVERILSKLDEQGRAAAASRATREGLLLPLLRA